MYWWVPLIPLLQRFYAQLQLGSKKRYWGKRVFGYKNHENKGIYCR